MKKILITAAILLLFCLTFSFASIPNGGMIQWDSPDGGSVVEGYRIYRGITSGTYTGVSPDTTENYMLMSQAFTDWVDSETYYLVVKAFNEAGESNPSNEVEYTVPFETIVEIPNPPRNLSVGVVVGE
jgi:hypothetical protein